MIDPEPFRGRSPLILVTDDDKSLRSLLVMALSADGYAIEEAVDGRDCLAKYERLQPDLVLMDAVMPEMDGFEACQQLRGLAGDNHFPILMITFLDDRDSIEQAFACGATDYITKPIHWAVLKQRVRHLLLASACLQRARPENGTLDPRPDWPTCLSRLLAALAQTPDITPQLAPILTECLPALSADSLSIYDADNQLILAVPAINSTNAPNPPALTVPLVARSRNLGHLSLDRRDPQPWADAVKTRCQDLARLLALALLTQSR